MNNHRIDGDYDLRDGGFDLTLNCDRDRENERVIYFDENLQKSEERESDYHNRTLDYMISYGVLGCDDLRNL